VNPHHGGEETDDGADHAGDGGSVAPADDRSGESGVVVAGVTVDRGGQRVLDGVALTARPGELVGLVGPNGAGKTTLLRTINGTLTPAAGTVRVDGDAVTDLSARERSRRVATVPQDTSVGFAFDVRTVVEMGRHPHRPRFGTDPDPGAVDRALARVDAADLADRSVDAISGGERSRVLLARALAQDADVLVLDEPTASLDINHQVRTLSLVRSVVDDDRAAVAAIHDLDLAARYCDRLVVLADGVVRASGPPETVLDGDTLRSAFGVEAAVAENPVTGSPTVTALDEDRP
jgi:iron complex transport system ATP-binding protein